MHQMTRKSSEAQDFLRLFKCTVATGTDVVSAFANRTLLPSHGGSFERFLDAKKHQIFHLWHSKKLVCCECLPYGCNIKRTGHMDNWMFRKLYNDNGPDISGHIVRNSRDIEQVCLHKYVTRNIAIQELDISTVSFLLQNLAKISRNETTSLDIITNTRNQICHAYSMTCYPLASLNTMWTDLENALADLADPSYKRIIKTQIQYLRKVDIEKEEITELIKNVEEVNLVLQDLKSSCNNNGMHVKGMESRLENMAINHTEDIKQHTAKQTSLLAQKAEKVFSEEIHKTKKKLENSINQEVKKVTESQLNSFHQLGTQLQDVHENQEKTQVKILKAIQNLTLSVKYERPANLLVPEELSTESMERPVLWQIATPEHWNIETVVATLRDTTNKDEQFKKKFVKKGSLLMLTTISRRIVSDTEAFEAAVISFLTKMIKDCDIDTSIPSRVDVTLHILNDNEVSISCELPLEVQEKHGTGNKQQLKKTFNIAFLNGDDRREIKWVHNMSKILKTRYDIKCCILAEEYLHGFPLKRILGLYFKTFQAVIISITKENYEQYDFYIEDDMPVIAVELDYVSEIRSNLRKYPYINCTTCEHLWFPRFLDTLRTLLPDHLGTKMEKDKGEIVEDCEQCKFIVNAAVYHRVELTKESSSKQLTLCGSIMDETWILNFLYQITNLTEPYVITSWEKSRLTPSNFDTKKVYFLISPNYQKALSFKNYHPPKFGYGPSLRAITITAAEMPYFLRWNVDNINATNMNQKEIADAIFGRGAKVTDELSTKLVLQPRPVIHPEVKDELSTRLVPQPRPVIHPGTRVQPLSPHHFVRTADYSDLRMNRFKRSEYQRTGRMIFQSDDSLDEIETLGISDIRRKKESRCTIQ